MAQHTHRCDEEKEERHTDDQDGKPGRQRDAGDRPGEVEDAGRERQQHVEQGTVGARVRHHVEETELAVVDVLLRMRERRLYGCYFHVTVLLGDLFRRAVCSLLYTS